MTKPGRQITCERCGAAFGCGAGTGACWCVAEPFRLPLPKVGESKFKDCLCPACLREAAAAGGADRMPPLRQG